MIAKGNIFEYRHWDSRDGIGEVTHHKVQIMVDGELIENRHFFGGNYCVHEHMKSCISGHISGKLRTRNKAIEVNKHNAMLGGTNEKHSD